MSVSLSDLLFTTPFGLGATFMLWVFWNFHKAGQRR